MKKNSDAFWKWVEGRMAELDIASFRELESRSGFANGAISRRKNALKLPTVEMAEGMCRALRVSWVELWTEAGFIQHVDAGTVLDPLLHEVVEAWPEIDRVGRETIRNMVQLMQERAEALRGQRPALRLVAEEGEEYDSDEG